MIRFLAVFAALSVLSLNSHAGVMSSDPCQDAYQSIQKMPLQVAETIQLPARIRTHVLCEIRTSIRTKYSLLEMKKARLSFDALGHLDQCIRHESSIAKSQLFEFYDRVLTCLAPFRDSHFSVSTFTPQSYIVTGIQFRRARGKIVVAGYDKKLLELTEKAANLAGGSLVSSLKLGAVVELIDGQKPEFWIERFSRFINASSQGFRDEQAVRSLSSRAFDYPKSSKQTIKLVGQEKPIVVEWYVYRASLRSDLRALLNEKMKFRSTMATGLDRKRPPDGYPGDYVGHDERNPLPITNAKTYYGSSTVDVAVRTGELELKNSKACYLQLIESTQTNLFAPRIPVPLERKRELGLFIADCKARGLATVVDLRYNHGGAFAIPLDDVGLFVKKDQAFPSAFTTSLFTPHIRQIYDVYNLGPEADPVNWNEFFDNRFFEAIREAEEKKLKYIPAVPERNVQANERVGGYELPVVVLISPSCVSGCEIMAGLLKNRANTIFVGQPTNGTGGMITSQRFASGAAPGWVDNTFGTISLRFPNTIFGMLSKPVESGHNLPFASVENQIRENRPIAPSKGFMHRLDIADVSENHRALLVVIDRALTVAAAQKPAEVKPVEPKAPATLIRLR